MKPFLSHSQKDRARMPVHHRAGLLFAILSLLSVIASAAEGLPDDAITGTWMVAEKDAYIDIYRQDDRYFGYISWLRGDNEKPGAAEAKIHEIPKVGLVIVRGFVFDGHEWKGGTLYNPTNGKSYRGVISLDAKGQLHVRGFIGISLLGRTTIWQRIK
jgi:uncharacterized protein (DUF2147 family)